MKYYIASCVFTAQFPELSRRIREWALADCELEVVRCCVGQYKVREFEEEMPDGSRDSWKRLPDSGNFQPGDTVYSLCHNCNNIIEEQHPGVIVRSLWELIDQTPAFPLPDYTGLTVTVQDCWRSRERKEEQAAVRSLLGKMNIRYVEAPEHHEQTDFCGISLYRPQPPRNPRLAPKHYVDGAAGKFIPHSKEEQEHLMKAYCDTLPTSDVICYCHYCLEGLKLGGANARHLAEVMFLVENP